MLRRTIYNTIRLQSDRIAKDVNLNKKTFSIDTFQFLNEDLNIVPTPKICNKYRLNEEIQTFSKKMKLKEYFKDLNENAALTEEQIFKPIN